MPKDKSIFGSIGGAEDLVRAFRDLPAAAEKKVLRPALRAGAKVALKRVKQLAPRDSGVLYRSLKVKAIKRSRKQIGSRIVTGEDFFRGQAFYGPMVELGYKRGNRKVAGQKFIRRGLYESEIPVRVEIIKVARQKLPKVILQVAAKAKK